jgi:hypothetical protein
MLTFPPMTLSLSSSHPISEFFLLISHIGWMEDKAFSAVCTPFSV